MITLTQACANAELSLLNHATVVSQVALPLVQFCTHWTQSPSNCDSLIALMMTCQWGGQSYQPIILGAEVKTLIQVIVPCLCSQLHLNLQ